MSAAAPERAPTPKSLKRWRKLVKTLSPPVVDEARYTARMPCPVHGGTGNNFVISAGRESDYPLLYCHSGCDTAEPDWHRRAVAAVRHAGASDSALPPVDRAAQSPQADPPRTPVLGLPSEAQVDDWFACLAHEEVVRRALRRTWNVTDQTLALAEVGWEPCRELVALPVRDLETEEVVQVIYRDLRDKRPQGAPKSQTHPGVTGSHLYAPAGLGADGAVLLCAGEKDLLRALEAGFSNVASFTNGEKALPPPERLEPLRGRDVVIVYDDDEAGRAGARRVATGLVGIASSVAIADLSAATGLGDVGDVSDVLVLVDGTSILRQVIEAAEIFIAPDDPLPEIKAALTLAAADAPDHYEELRTDADLGALPSISYAVRDWFPTGGYSVLYGEPGIGKTLALLDIARSIATGLPWHTNTTAQGAVVMYQGEGLAQLPARNAAWNAAHDRAPDLDLPVRYTDEIVDLGKPEGLAAVVRTVRRVAEAEQQPVRAVIFDPLVEYMSGDENGEGMRDVSLGLRVLAQMLDCAVIVGHHTNASGQRERGAAFLRMRAQAFVRMERLSGGGVGVVQQKQRNGERLALRLDLEPEGESVVFATAQVLSAEDYEARHESADASERHAQRARHAEELLLNAIREEPGITRDRLIKECKGNGIGSGALTEVLAALIASGKVRTESGPRGAFMHYLTTPPHPPGRGPD